jgi:hypothetical protein
MERSAMEELTPFQILGLDILALKDLKVSQWRKLIEKQYRAMQLLFHPDIEGGSVEKSTAINWANEELSTDRGLKMWLGEALGSAKAKQYGKLVATEAKLTAVSHLSMNVYLEACRNCQSSYVDLLGIGNEPLRISRSVTMKRVDSFIINVLDRVKDVEERKKISRQERERVKQSQFFKLQISGGKLLETDYLGKVSDISDRLLVGIITGATILNVCNGSPITQFLKTICKVKRTAAGYLTASGPKPSVINDERVVIAAKDFERLLPYLDLKFVDGWNNWLFSMKLVDDWPTFSLEGQIIDHKSWKRILGDDRADNEQ